MKIARTSTHVHAETVPGLEAKRSALERELRQAEADAYSLSLQIQHLDTVLEGLGINRNPKHTIRETYRGENAGLVLAVLESASKRFTATEIAHQVLLRRRFPLTDPRLLRLMALRVRDILRQMKEKGIAFSTESTGPTLEWSL